MPKGFVFDLPSAVYPKFPEIKKIKELQAIWESWTVERQYVFTAKYRDIALLLPIEIDEQLLKAIILFWDPSYRCFTFNHENLTPTVEEYAALLRISPLNPNKVFLEKVKEGPVQKEVGTGDEYRRKRLYAHDQEIGRAHV